VDYLVPNSALYQWQDAATVLTSPRYGKRLIYAGRQTNGQPNYVCRVLKRGEAMQDNWLAGKSDGNVCWGWDGEKEQLRQSDWRPPFSVFPSWGYGFEFLMKV
jgi:hypothetical protein